MTTYCITFGSQTFAYQAYANRTFAHRFLPITHLPIKTYAYQKLIMRSRLWPIVVGLLPIIQNMSWNWKSSSKWRGKEKETQNWGAQEWSRHFCYQKRKEHFFKNLPCIPKVWGAHQAQRSSSSKNLNQRNGSGVVNGSERSAIGIEDPIFVDLDRI